MWCGRVLTGAALHCPGMVLARTQLVGNDIGSLSTLGTYLFVFLLLPLTRTVFLAHLPYRINCLTPPTPTSTFSLQPLPSSHVPTPCRDLKLSDGELRKVIGKSFQVMKAMSPAELPAVIYQLLTLSTKVCGVGSQEPTEGCPLGV